MRETVNCLSIFRKHFIFTDKSGSLVLFVCLIKRRSIDSFESNVFYLVFNDLKHLCKVFYMKSSSSLFQATHRLWTGIIGDLTLDVKWFLEEFEKFLRSSSTYIDFTYLRVFANPYRHAFVVAFSIHVYPVSGWIRIVSNAPLEFVNLISQFCLSTPLTVLAV